MTSCWIITEEGLTGTENQCLGVAYSLGVDPEIKRITLRQPWKTLSPWLGFEHKATFSGSPLNSPWPDLLIAAGRKSIAASRYIKRQSQGKTFTIQLQDPKCSPSHFDLVAVPAHDSLRGDNVIVTQATPNRVTSALLRKSRAEFASFLGSMEKPRVAVLIGGNSRTHTITDDIATTLAQHLKALAKDYSLMITTSRRTPEAYCLLIEEALKNTDAYLWDGTGDNPYYGFLAWANYILVTNDSASMISEALTTAIPTYIIPLKGGSPRFDKLHDNLLEQNKIRRFEGTLEPYDYAPLRDSAFIAEEIQKRLKTV